LALIPNSGEAKLSVAAITGGEFPKIRAECQYYHGNTTSKREEEHQRYDESLHG
jgi:hypothetical protein